MPTEPVPMTPREADLAWQVEGLLGMRADVEAVLIAYGLPEWEVRGQFLDVAVEKLLKLNGVSKPTQGE